MGFLLKLKAWFVLFLAFCLIVPATTYAGSIKDGSSGTPGQWYYGETPGSVLDSKYPILFVHGLNSSSDTWYNNNDMYATAFQNGYETSFIDLNSDKSMWANGQLLAQKVQEIYQHFGEKVVVVAHSKGGIDTQSALVHYGADPYIERLITLSTPHYGSELADLAYSGWAGWLAGILGSKNEATYSLQTGYMDYFRSQTDNHPNVYQTPIYTVGGTKWGSFGSALYWGGLYLSGYGSNDGAVTVSSSRLPYATEIAVGDWNHTTVKEGSSTFAVFKNYLNEQVYAMSSFKAQSVESEAKRVGNFIRGGEYSGKAVEHIDVEAGAQSVTFDWISDQKDAQVTLISPDKKVRTDFEVHADETEFFNGAYHHTVTVDHPQAGKWMIEASSANTEHYLLHSSFDSTLNDLIGVALENGNVEVTSKNKDFKLKTDMTIDFYKNGKLKQKKVVGVKADGESYNLPNLGEGVYNMTLDVSGQYKKEKFNRTIVQTVYVDDQGKLYFQ
ncbi:hypothetical protein EQV77_06620 [Halobacillus fulvus]|nr:hypothetical protein EQV77_06620 [Halobacillus fulvus]